MEHCVPSLPVVNPGVHVHEPLAPHTPLLQLQVDGASATVGIKHRPVPVMPSSQVVQPVGHAWHVGPKNPEAQVSQEVPLNPVWHWHVPDVVHTPAVEQEGVHADDWISKRERDPCMGSWAMSGTEFQMMTRLLAPASSATHAFDDTANELAVTGVEVFC